MKKALLVFLLAIFLSVIVINCSFATLTIWWWNRPLYRRITGYHQFAFISATVAMFGESRLVLSGRLPDNSDGAFDPSILVMNHQTDVDWLYGFMALLVTGRIAHMKAIAKREIMFIPFLGLVMYMCEMIFVKRNWLADKATLESKLGGFIEEHFPFCVLIFPEGTTVNAEALEKSQAFAAERKRPHLKNLLLPRYKGFKAITDALSGKSAFVYDTTMAFGGYKGEIPPASIGYEREKDLEVPSVNKLLSGHITSEVHVNMERFPLAEVVSAPGGIEGWLDSRWKRKDEMMIYFAEHQRFPPDKAIDQRSERPNATYFPQFLITSVAVTLLTSGAYLLRAF